MINNLKRANRGTKKNYFSKRNRICCKAESNSFLFSTLAPSKKVCFSSTTLDKKANRTNINVDLVPTVCIFFIKSNSKKIKCESWIEKVVNQRCPPGSTLSRMDSGLYQTQTIPDSAQLDYELYQTALNIDLTLSRTAISLTLRYPWQRLSLTRQYPGQNLAWLIGVPESAQLYSMLSQTAFSWTQRYPGQRLAWLSAVLL